MKKRTARPRLQRMLLKRSCNNSMVNHPRSQTMRHLVPKSYRKWKIVTKRGWMKLQARGNLTLISMLELWKVLLSIVLLKQI